jgi:hypothetical protein
MFDRLVSQPGRAADRRHLTECRSRYAAAIRLGIEPTALLRQAVKASTQLDYGDHPGRAPTPTRGEA